MSYPQLPGQDGGGSSAPVGWTEVSGATQTAEAGGKYYVTYAGTCDITTPTWAEGVTVQVMNGSVAGTVSRFVIGGGGTKIPNEALQISGAGKRMAIEGTNTSNEWNCVGHDPTGAVHLGTYATYAALQTAYPKNGAALAALAKGSSAFVTDMNAFFIPNAAGTNWRPQSGKLRLSGGGYGVMASPISTLAAGGTTNVKWSGVTSPQIPANFLNPGDRVYARQLVQKTGTGGTSEVRFTINTADSFAGSPAYISSQATGSPANFLETVGRMTVVSSTQAIASRGTAQGVAAAPAVYVTVTIDTTVLNYCVLSVQPYSAADSFSLYDAEVWVESAL